MRDITTIETQRQAEQSRLDALKDAKQRNRLGQFATPPGLSLEIARFARSLWNARGPVRFLDPAIGSGSFYSALLQAFPANDISDAFGVEVDPWFAGAAGNLWTPTGLRVVQGDFTTLFPERRFNLILTNPPYVRHHHIAAADKPRLQALSRQIAGVRPSGLSGLYCYFLFLTHAWMAEDALAVWLIPSEFMNVNYGGAVKRYLTSRVTLLRVHRFDPKYVQFDDALVTSAVVSFANRPPRSGDTATFTYGGTLAAPSLSEDIPVAELHRVPKWTSLPHSRRATDSQTVRLADLFTIKRGLATGSNSFFILPRDEALQKGIPPEALKPILPSPRHLRTSVVDANTDGWPALPKPLALIDCSVPEDELKRTHPAFQAYLDSGRGQGVDRGYLASRRRPWYSQEHRPPAPFLCTYMGRQRETAKPFRFIWNKSRATAANVYLLLYPRPNMARSLAAHPRTAETVFEALNRLDIEHMISNGRVYGGGLHKLEPSELGNLPAAGVAEAAGIDVTDHQVAASLAQFEFAF